jgi:uncharacterized membrane protein YoaK (UPF0700 family)
METLREAAQTFRPSADAKHGPLVPMMLVLTVITGVVDAASYLRLGHVFVANMTGNVVFLGFAIAGAQGLSAVSSLVALGAFLLGAVVGGKLGARWVEHRGRVLRAGSGAQAALLVLALVVGVSVSQPLSSGARYALLVPLALAMGVQNAAAQRLAVPELTTTVLTRTLTGIASEATLAGGAGAKLGRRFLAVAAMLIGALIGGLLALHVSIGAAIAVALALAAAVAVWVHLVSRSDAPWTRA